MNPGSGPILHSLPGTYVLKLVKRLRRTVVIDASCGCHLWTGTQLRGGYGAISIVVEGHHRLLPVHRVAWEFSNGSIPRGKAVRHLCRHNHCINPDHLYLGAPDRKLSDKDVVTILWLPAVMGWGQSEIARQYGVSQPTVSAILSGVYRPEACDLELARELAEGIREPLQWEARGHTVS